MNKIKTTRREMREHNFVVSCGYCCAQNLLRYESAVAYSVGVYGWACDYYDLGGSIVLSTGYSPVGTSVYELIRKYDRKAAVALERCGYNFDKGSKICKRLIEQLRGEIVSGGYLK